MKAKYYPTRDCYRIIVPARFSETGKEQAKYFKTKEDAEAEIRRILGRGTSAQPKLDERKHAILTLAAQHGLELEQIEDAFKLYRSTILNVAKRAHLFEAVSAYYARQEHEGRARRSLSSDRTELSKLCSVFGNVDITHLTEPAMRQYLKQYPPGTTRRGHYTRVKAFLRWAHQEGYLAIDVMARIKPMDPYGINKDIIDIEDYRRLLFVTAGLEPIEPGQEPTTEYLRLLPYYVLGGMAGLRRCEMLRDHASDEIIDWDDILWSKNLIRIRHEVAKRTKAQDRRRWPPLEPAAKEWLRLVAREGGPVIDVYQATHTKLVRKLLTKLQIELPDNGLRNSYCSYGQSFRSPGEVAKAAGDLESTIKRFYVQELEPETGRAWFDIRPDTEKKIVPMPAA